MSEEPTPPPVLIAYDGSDAARSAIAEAGRQLRTPRHARVLTVWTPLEDIPFWGPAMTRFPDELLQGARHEAEKLAAEGAELASSAGFEAEPLVTSGEAVWRSVIDAADAIGAGLIVTGSHGRGTIGSAVLGSVATAVAHHATVPVLICRMPA